MADEAERLEPGRRRFRFTYDHARAGIATVESGVYLVVGVLLIVAGGLILVETGESLLDGLDENAPMLSVALRVLDRILLLLIIAELLYTLQLVVARGEIFAEPFLVIGLIAVVRRVVVITAEIEEIPAGGRELTNFLLELGILAVLALGFGVAVYLLRRSAAAAPDTAIRSRSPA